MISVDLLNGWGASWWGFMARALVDSTVLMALVLLVWMPLRRKMSAQLGTRSLLPGAPQAHHPRAGRVAGKASVAPPKATAAAKARPLIVPTTGDLSMSVTDAPASQPLASVATGTEPASERTPPAIASSRGYRSKRWR